MIEGFHLIPEHMRNDLDLYLRRGIPPGSFMLAVLRNDLVDAYARADHINQHRIRDYADFLYNYAPSIPVRAWGSPEAVSHWIESGGADGLGLTLKEVS